MNLNISRTTTCTILLFSVLFASCSPQILKERSKTSIVYPAPPDPAKIQYLTSISNSKQVEKKQSAFEKSVVGERGGKLIMKPYGTFIRNGKIYISDVSLSGGLDIIDLEKKEFNYFVPRGAFKLKLVLNSYVDTNNRRYLVDATLHKIVVFDSIGTYITSFGKDENLKPTDIFIQGSKIYVADSNNNRINIYNKNTYKFEDYFPKSEPGDEDYLYKPANITVSNDKVYVSDMGNGNVKIYNLNGEFLSSVGQYGDRIGDFVRPKGIAVDREGNLYVVDGSFENVQIFNKEGKLLMFFGGAYNGHGDMYLPTNIAIDYDHLKYFKKYVNPKYSLKYLIFVTNQFGPDKISIYGRVEPSKKIDSTKIKIDKKN